jgi:hypothetical protein
VHPPLEMSRLARVRTGAAEYLSPESTGAPDNAVENRGTGTAEHVDSEPPSARLMAAAQLLQSRTEVDTGMAFLTTTLVAGAPALGEGGDADGAPTVAGASIPSCTIMQ